jgi:hypothetical protein
MYQRPMGSQDRMVSYVLRVPSEPVRGVSQRCYDGSRFAQSRTN